MAAYCAATRESKIWFAFEKCMKIKKLLILLTDKMIDLILLVSLCFISSPFSLLCCCCRCEMRFFKRPKLPIEWFIVIYWFSLFFISFFPINLSLLIFCFLKLLFLFFFFYEIKLLRNIFFYSTDFSYKLIVNINLHENLENLVM